jgi:hypothetical protein
MSHVIISIAIVAPLSQVRTCWKRSFEASVRTRPRYTGTFGSMLQSLRDPSCNDAHFGLFHAARGERRGADAYATGLHGRVGVVGDRVLVDGDASLAEREFRLGAEDSLLEDVDEHEVGVGASGNDAVSLGG